MINHVGTHNNKKVVIVFREVPGEDHMALVLYPDTLPTAVHDDIMSCIESDIGQQAKHLGDAMHRVVGSNGQNLLHMIHRESWMKKVRTQDVILVPVPGKEGARLDEINKIIKAQTEGAEAAKRMAEIDATAGFADPDKTAAAKKAVAAITGSGNALNDVDLAAGLMDQASKMQTEVETLTSEVTRLKEEAAALNPGLKPTPKKRGRPKKVKTVA
jgi:tRNA(Phe) wybutosine-synthesizing methylase Tyw3